MLENLHVKNYVLIDDLDLDFSKGFTCITGETGSGKTIILGALSLLLGQKADKEAVRKGASSAEISGVFSIASRDVLKWLDEHNIEIDDDEILIRRVIKDNGRSLYSVNGSSISRSEGEELGLLLVDVSSQHAHQSLMKSETIRAMLDEASGSEKVLHEYSNSYMEYKAKEKELEELKSLLSKSNEEAEYMRYCLNEIEKADLKIGEEEDLKESIALISSSEFLREAMDTVEEEMKSATSSLNGAFDSIKKAARKDPKLLEYSSRLENISIESDDICISIREYMESIIFSEYELQEKNERLSEIQKAKRRFGGSVEEALRIKDEYSDKLQKYEDGAELTAKLEKETAKARNKAIELSYNLRDMREKGARKLERAIQDNLNKLGMKSAEMRIDVEDMSSLSQFGRDRISFKMAPNKGEKFSDIQNTASGGELSRLMLALKVSLKSAGGIETLLFDEIDSGIGGVVANNVSEELQRLSKTHQVLAITHLPQLAVKADSHFLVYKEESNGRTLSHIKRIEGDERIREIARLLSGETSNISLQHAKALLEVQ